ncbi:DUF6531 domain-containing protein [Microbulbifer sp.]|uniref:DUF6531 domain-containing protein n=1 Tax=Microbulbifer sp. TaxID=1908541 RepID=UPI002F944189
MIAANGELAFYRTDFELPGPFPFRWQRFYRQSADTEQGFGNGWRHTLSEALQLPEVTAEAEPKVILHTAEGRSIAFDLPAIGHASFNRCERLYLLRQSLHSFLIGGFAKADKIFRADGIGHVAPLCEIRDAFGNTLSVDYRNGQPHKIITSWGRTLECIFDGAKLTKIINTQSPGDWPLCSYSFDDQHLLAGAEAGGDCESYNYENGQLNTITSLNGSIRFSFDRIGRCHQLQQDSLEFDLRWQASRRQCTLTCGDRHDTLWQFDERGDLILERQGQRESRFLYDHYRNLCLHQEADGQRTLFRHDEFGRLLRRTRNGMHQRFTYDSQGRLLVAANVAPQADAVRWIFSYGERSRPSTITDPAGHKWRCDYDERGQLRQLTDPEAGIITLRWDGQSQLRELQRGDRHCRFNYDQMGRLNNCSGLHLRKCEWQYDANGALIRTEIGGSTFTIVRDQQQRPCAINQGTVDSAEPLLQWQYDEHNLIRHVHLASSLPWSLAYNRHGQLSGLGIGDSNFHWCYDGYGRLREFSDHGGRKREWQYDENGQVSEYRDSDNHWYLEYDASGALAQIRNNNGQHCRFHFDDGGRLVLASNDYCHQRFRYDNRNRLIAEHHDITIDNRRESLSINHDYDARGWLRTSSSDNINIAYIFSASGALYGMDANGKMLLRTECEDSGIDESSGMVSETWNLGDYKVERHFFHGTLGCIALAPEHSNENPEQWRWQVNPEGAAAAGVHVIPDFILTRAEPLPQATADLYDQRGNIVNEVRATAGEQLYYQYQFDGWGLMHSAECGDFSTYFRYDPFGRRLMKTSSHRRSHRQRRVSSYWSSFGLWHETSRLDDSRTTTHYLHHPLHHSPLARLTRVDAHRREEGNSAHEQRHFYVADDSGHLLALLDADAPEKTPLWDCQQEPSPNSRGPGAFRGSDGILDGETQLVYREFSYWHLAVDGIWSAPLDAGQRLVLDGRDGLSTDREYITVPLSDTPN